LEMGSQSRLLMKRYDRRDEAGQRKGKRNGWLWSQSPDRLLAKSFEQPRRPTVAKESECTVAHTRDLSYESGPWGLRLLTILHDAAAEPTAELIGNVSPVRSPIDCVCVRMGRLPAQRTVSCKCLLRISIITGTKIKQSGTLPAVDSFLLPPSHHHVLLFPSPPSSSSCTSPITYSTCTHYVLQAHLPPLLPDPPSCCPLSFPLSSSLLSSLLASGTSLSGILGCIASMVPIPPRSTMSSLVVLRPPLCWRRPLSFGRQQRRPSLAAETDG
jgi:hypothetical protein